MKLTLKRQEEKVYLDDVLYIMLEASDAVHEQYQMEFKRGSKLTGEGRNLIYGDGILTCDALLVSLCLYKANAQEQIPRTDKGVPDQKALTPLSTIKTWPRNAVKELIDLAKRMAGIQANREDLVRERNRLNELIKRLDEANKSEEEDEEKN